MQGSKGGWCVWFVGLPGCGKSSISKRVYEELVKEGWRVVRLEMDVLRKQFFPNPSYTPKERERAYTLFVEEALVHFFQGMGVIMDGTAYKREMRRLAREKMGERFAEVYVKCNIYTAMKRESSREGGLVMAGLYKKALERKQKGTHFPGLGEVIGVDVEFEEDEMCEYVLENDNLSLEEATSRVLSFVRQWLASLQRKGLI